MCDWVPGLTLNQSTSSTSGQVQSLIKPDVRLIDLIFSLLKITPWPDQITRVLCQLYQSHKWVIHVVEMELEIRVIGKCSRNGPVMLVLMRTGLELLGVLCVNWRRISIQKDPVTFMRYSLSSSPSLLSSSFRSLSHKNEVTSFLLALQLSCPVLPTPVCCLVHVDGDK